MRARGWTTKTGVEMRSAHDLPHMVLLREVAVSTSPHLEGFPLIVITEAWRPALHPDDAHTWCNAFDFRVSNIKLGHGETLNEAAWDWVARMRKALGNDSRFQFDAHGEGPSFHIHGEFDPRK